jgi:hypothetical protein
METKTIGGYKYVVNFINVHTRKIWVYFMKTKSEVFNYFWNVKNMVGKKRYKHKAPMV